MSLFREMICIQIRSVSLSDTQMQLVNENRVITSNYTLCVCARVCILCCSVDMIHVTGATPAQVHINPAECVALMVKAAHRSHHHSLL